MEALESLPPKGTMCLALQEIHTGLSPGGSLPRGYRALICVSQGLQAAWPVSFKANTADFIQVLRTFIKGCGLEVMSEEFRIFFIYFY